MRFMFRCGSHETVLEGQPKLVHPVPEAELVWEFNIHEMQCPTGKKGPFTNGCRKSWRVHMQLDPQEL